jgi:hypothetical protein
VLRAAAAAQAAKAAKKAAEFEEHKAINAEVVARITAPYRCGSAVPRARDGARRVPRARDGARRVRAAARTRV